MHLASSMKLGRVELPFCRLNANRNYCAFPSELFPPRPPRFANRPPSTRDIMCAKRSEPNWTIKTSHHRQLKHEKEMQKLKLLPENNFPTFSMAHQQPPATHTHKRFRPLSHILLIYRGKTCHFYFILICEKLPNINYLWTTAKHIKILRTFSKHISRAEDANK